jgi:RND family efflux transporter MFP subunit
VLSRWHDVVLAAVIVVAVPACRRADSVPPKSAAVVRSPAVVASAVVQARTVPRFIEVTGTLVADAHAEVAAETSGRVVAVAVERGTQVAAGAIVARMDDRDALNLVREVEAAEAQAATKVAFGPGGRFDPESDPEVQKVRLVMEQMKTDDERYARLVSEGAVSPAEAESRHIQYLSAKEEYRAVQQRTREAYQALLSQQARLQTARKALADTVIRAPFDGVVAERHVNVGQFLQRGARTATLVRVDPLRIELMVPETATVAVRNAQKVSFSVQAYPDRWFEGRIAYVGPSLRSDSRALVAEAVVANAERLLHPGFFATARIELPSTDRALFVPAAAVRTEGSVSKLFVLKDGRAEQRFVQIGRQTDGQIEIVRGLVPGDRVATSGLDQLGDGVAVQDGARQ